MFCRGNRETPPPPPRRSPRPSAVCRENTLCYYYDILPHNSHCKHSSINDILRRPAEPPSLRVPPPAGGPLGSRDGSLPQPPPTTTASRSQRYGCHDFIGFLSRHPSPPPPNNPSLPTRYRRFESVSLFRYMIATVRVSKTEKKIVAHVRFSPISHSFPASASRPVSLRQKVDRKTSGAPRNVLRGGGGI